MKLVCIADFRINEHGLWESFKDGECLFIEKVLNKDNIETYTYYEKELGSTTDIAEDLTSFSDELIILMTDETNYKLNIALSKKIIDEEEECKVVLKIREGIKDINSLDISSDNCVVIDNFEDLFKEIDEENVLDNLTNIELYSDLANVNQNTNNVRILLGFKLNKINFRDFGSIKNDLSKLCNNDKKMKIEFSGIFLEDYEYGSELLEWLTKYKDDKIFVFNTNLGKLKNVTKNNIFYNIYIPSDYIKNNKTDLAMVKDNINKVCLNIDIFNNSKLAKNIINTIIKYTENIEFIGKLNIMLDTIKKCIPKKYFDLMNLQYQTLSRGILYSKTGEYVSVPMSGFAKHIYVNKSNVDDEVINFVNEVCSINSSILVDEIYDKSNSNVCSIDKLDKICIKNDEVNSIENIEEKNSSLPLNVAYIDNDKLNINGITNNADLKLIEMPFSEYKPSKNKDYRNMYIFTIDTENDLECFLNQVDEFYNTKQIYKSFLIDGKLKNMCRFMSRNYCSVTKIPRLAINENREVCPCYEMNEKIGNLNNSVYELTQEVYYKHQMRLKDSKCATCSANIACSKCVYMPEFLKSKYCDIMINKPYVTDFLIESMILSNLSRINVQIEKLDFKDIHISNEIFQNILPDDLWGEELPYFTKYAFLIQGKNFYAVWSPNTNKTFSITKEIAVVCEALFKRLKYNDIIQVVAKYNNMSIEDAKIFCDKVFKILFNNNMLYRQVTIKD